MIEVTARNEGGAPYQIDDWLRFPYKYFSWMLGGKNKSLLDLACGANQQRPILDQEWGTVRSGDYEAVGPTIEKMDLTSIPTTTRYDAAFCFESIEHVDRGKHYSIIRSFMEIIDSSIVFGTVNLDGQSFLDEHNIWKGDVNPHHVAEYRISEWETQFRVACNRSDWRPSFFTSFYNGGGQWEMRPGLSNDGVSIYALLRK
jgi:hypothetical protein